MKKLEKLKLSEMQDFSAIEKDESQALKGGRWYANDKGWNTWFYFYYNGGSGFGSGSYVLSQGERFFYEGRSWQNAQNFVMGSYSDGSGCKCEVDVPDGVNGNFIRFNGSYFGDIGVTAKDL